MSDPAVRHAGVHWRAKPLVGLWQGCSGLDLTNLRPDFDFVAVNSVKLGASLGCSALLCFCPDLSASDYSRLLAVCAAVGAHSPVVLMTELTVANLRRLSGPKGCAVVGLSEVASLARVLLQNGAKQSRQSLIHLAESSEVEAVFRLALISVLGASVPTIAEARRRREAGVTVFPRRVGQIAAAVGASDSYLRKAARQHGFKWSRVLTLNALARGLELQSQGVIGHQVATRLGFSSASAWSSFATRATGRSPTKDPFGTYQDCMLQLEVELCGVPVLNVPNPARNDRERQRGSSTRDL